MSAADEAAAMFAAPPKPSHHPEDAPSRSPSPAPSTNTFNPSPAPHLPRSYSSTNGRAANTGPKGVIADARAFERARSERQQSPSGHSSSGRKWFLGRDEKKLARPGSSSSSRRSTPERDDERWRAESGSRDGLRAEDNDEEGFMDRWRRNKMSEMRLLSQQALSGGGASHGASVRRYGRVEAVDADGYLEAISVKNVGKETVVVVCIYDDEVCFDPGYLRSRYTFD